MDGNNHLTGHFVFQDNNEFLRHNWNSSYVRVKIYRFYKSLFRIYVTHLLFSEDPRELQTLPICFTGHVASNSGEYFQSLRLRFNRWFANLLFGLTTGTVPLN